MQTFRVGDKAVYPGQGVGEVLGIEHKEIAGQRQSFYVLKILENNMKIMIPINKVGSVGLRDIISEEEVAEVYSILRTKTVAVDSTTWNRRYREYMEKIKTGSVFEIAEVLRDLSLLKNGKELSFGERKMLDHARSLLVREIAKIVARLRVRDRGRDEVREAGKPGGAVGRERLGVRAHRDHEPPQPAVDDDRDADRLALCGDPALGDPG